MSSERFTLVGYVDNLYYVHDSLDDEVDPMNAAQIKHAIGLGLSIAGVHPTRGSRDFSYTEENFIQLPDVTETSVDESDIENYQQLQDFVAGMGSYSDESDEDYESESDDFADDFYEDDDNSFADDTEEVEEQETEDDFVAEDDDFYEEDEDFEDEEEVESEYDFDTVDEDDDFYVDWDDAETYEDGSAFQQLTDSLTPEQNHVLAEYYMLRSKLCFDENITSNANINSAFTAVNNMNNIVRVNINPNKLAKINAYKQPGKTWVYAGFIDTVARTGEMSYCTFGHALRYKHIVININKIQLGDILYSYTGNDLKQGSHGYPRDFINLDVIEQGVFDGDIVEFGATCLADFFDVSPEVMAYVKQVQAQSLEEMGELMRYYVEEQRTPGTLQNAMDEFKFFDEVMNLLVMDSVRKITAGKESELLVPKEYISIYKRFVEVNKSATSNGNLPLLYPRSLIRVIREYLTGIRAYNSVEFSRKTSKKTHNSYVSVSGLNRVIKNLPYLKSGCIYDFLNIVVGNSISKICAHPWSYRFISSTAPKAIEKNLDGEYFLSGKYQLVPNSFITNNYTSRILSWFDNNRNEFIGPTMINDRRRLPDYIGGISLWLLNAFLFDFCGIYGYKRTAPGDDTNDRAIYKLDGGSSKNTEYYYRNLANYRFYSFTTEIGRVFDCTKVEYNLGYLEKLFVFDYYQNTVENYLPRGIRLYNISKDSRGMLSLTRKDDGAFDYLSLGRVDSVLRWSFRDILKRLVNTFDSDSVEYASAAYLRRDADNCLSISNSGAVEDNIAYICSEFNLGFKGYKDALIDTLNDGYAKLLEKVCKALRVYESAAYNYLESYISQENEQTLKVLDNATKQAQDMANETLEQLDAEVKDSGLNLNGDTSTLSSNNRILVDLRDNGVSAFSNYSPQDLAMFASYLMTTQYADAFRSMNAGITAKILETLQSTKFVRVSDKQLYRIKQVLEALIPRFQQDSIK